MYPKSCVASENVKTCRAFHLKKINISVIVPTWDNIFNAKRASNFILIDVSEHFCFKFQTKEKNKVHTFRWTTQLSLILLNNK